MSQQRVLEATSPRTSRRVLARRARGHGFGYWFWRLFRRGVMLVLLAVVAGLAFVWWVDNSTASLIHNFDSPDLPSRHVAMVFGAGLNRSGAPSAILYDRIATAVDLYKLGKVEKLLMTGDNSAEDYNEVEAMRVTAVAMGVPDADIVLDHAGFSTYESCYRGRDVFGIGGAILVTNRYHLPRALHICQSLGLDVVGTPSDRIKYGTSYYSLREIPALLASQLWLMIDRKPTYLGDPINIDVPQRPVSADQ